MSTGYNVLGYNVPVVITDAICGPQACRGPASNRCTLMYGPPS